MKQNRRDWLRVALGSSAAVLPVWTPRRVMAYRAPKQVVIDTHLHCFAGAADSRFPYHERAPYRPESPATPQHLLKCMDEGGVDFAVVVHPEPYQDDHRYLEHCLEVGGKRLRGTCLFFADRPDSIQAMPAFLKRHEGRMIAARIHAYAPGRLPPFGKPELRQLWKIATDHNVALQLHMEPRYAKGFTPYLREFRDATVIIDHLGRPMQGTPEEHDVILRWSEREKTIMKVSAIPDQNKYPHRNLGPALQKIVANFGSDRLIYGGGFNAQATGATYRAYRDMVGGLLAGMDANERAKVLGGNAAALLFS